MPSVCLALEGTGINRVRSVLSPRQTLSLAEKGTKCVSVSQKGNKLPKTRVVRTTAQGSPSTMEMQQEEPVILPAAGRKRQRSKKAA